MVLLSATFSKLTVFGTLDLTKTKVLAQLFVTLLCPRSLEVCQSPYPNALPCPSRVPATRSLSIHWDPLPAGRPHVPRCKCPVLRSKKNMDRAHLERNRVLSTCFDRCSCQRLGEINSQPEHGFAHLPHHTSAVLQKFWCPPFR